MIGPDTQWREFPLDEVAVIASNKRLERSKLVDGPTPYVASSAVNNGVTAFAGNSHVALRENVLGVNYNGSVGKAFYHPYWALFTDDVKTLRLKSGPNNRHTLLFLATCIEKQRGKYEYGYKFNGARMARQKILLPVDAQGEPDWSEMETTMKLIEQRLLRSISHRMGAIHTTWQAP
ncbi:restriction endonuclease subunit S [Brachybacterium vulturis]|uniref:restriction endonuclease subunit S n=1 Tax=Brachybacterium vulturis TaxID=2017484 RepID=UPI00373685A4